MVKVAETRSAILPAGGAGGGIEAMSGVFKAGKVGTTGTEGIAEKAGATDGTGGRLAGSGNGAAPGVATGTVGTAGNGVMPGGVPRSAGTEGKVGRVAGAARPVVAICTG
jgi:hypothetical protein